MTTTPARDGTVLWTDEVPALFSLDETAGGASRTPYSLWAEKTGRYRLPRIPSKDDWTGRFRSLVARQVAEEQGFSFEAGGQTALRGALGYRPLGLAKPNASTDPPFPVLALLITEEEWEATWRPAGENPPAAIYIEALAAIAATRTSQALVGALIAGERTKAWMVAADADLIGLIGKQVQWFLDRHVFRDVAPPTNPDQDQEAMAATLAIATKGKEIDLTGDAEAEEALRTWLTAEPIVEREGTRLRDAKRRVLLRMGDAEKARVGGHLVTTQSYPPTTISYERKAYRALSLTTSQAASTRAARPTPAASPPAATRDTSPPRPARSSITAPGPAPAASSSTSVSRPAMPPRPGSR